MSPGGWITSHISRLRGKPNLAVTVRYKARLCIRRSWVQGLITSRHAFTHYSLCYSHGNNTPGNFQAVCYYTAITELPLPSIWSDYMAPLLGDRYEIVTSDILEMSDISVNLLEARWRATSQAKDTSTMILVRVPTGWAPQT
jgi:hypothetical protein